MCTCIHIKINLGNVFKSILCINIRGGLYIYAHTLRYRLWCSTYRGIQELFWWRLQYMVLKNLHCHFMGWCPSAFFLLLEMTVTNQAVVVLEMLAVLTGCPGRCMFTATELWALGNMPKNAVCFLLGAKLDFMAKSRAKSKDGDNKVTLQWHCNETLSGKPRILWRF